MSRRLLPIVLVGMTGITTLTVATVGVAYAGSRALRAAPFHHIHGPDIDREAMARQIVGELLDEIDAPDEQSVQVEAILEGAHTQLEALHEGHDEHHEQVKTVLTAETVDASAVEELRLEAVDTFDQASQVFAGVVVDIGAVLSAEQRAELAELAAEMHGR